MKFNFEMFVSVTVAVIVSAIILSFVLPKITGEKATYDDDDIDLD